ncbi:hypothetical protein ACLGI4_20830 [Streptomyces sp. HMX112]|uniref:hypothetical protein n=1 Tax=Streptomyces sp. HMX112 TaxID=3390850 RepID=UPI003A80E8F6
MSNDPAEFHPESAPGGRASGPGVRASGHRGDTGAGARVPGSEGRTSGAVPGQQPVVLPVQPVGPDAPARPPAPATPSPAAGPAATAGPGGRAAGDAHRGADIPAGGAHSAGDDFSAGPGGRAGGDAHRGPDDNSARPGNHTRPDHHAEGAGSPGPDSRTGPSVPAGTHGATGPAVPAADDARTAGGVPATGPVLATGGAQGGVEPAGRDGAPASARQEAAGLGGLVPEGERDELTDRMHHALAGFVDDPRGAVAEAAGVMDAAADRLTAALAEQRRALRTAWDGERSGGAQGPDTSHVPDTEQLRVTLRTYREMTERLLRA